MAYQINNSILMSIQEEKGIKGSEISNINNLREDKAQQGSNLNHYKRFLLFF
jgi:hypothetical protein